MRLVLRSLALVLVVTLAAAGPLASQDSQGSSGANIVFGSRRQGEGVGTSSQFGETHATSVQNSTGDGQQTNRGEAGAVSMQKQTGLGGATQATNNQGAVQALQTTGTGGSDGSSDGSDSGSGGAGRQVSNNQVNIVSSQRQQNVEGSLINVQGGNKGVVMVNRKKPGQARALGMGGSLQMPDAHQTSRDNTLLQIMDNNEIILVITANKTEKIVQPEPIPEGPSCRYFCIRPTTNEPYCCDDGTNRAGDPSIHGGKCPRLRLLCIRFSFFNKCAHDGQCAASDKCCYDACIDMHICKRADPI
ncbi:uncharacterized protein LOC122374462 isoform X1 [Amphibalanus amphitrite]|uniref:uncharacterized protein LOC122374462 isoform X1 n=1 Tax=Amphibalanus amphitrite TaxID=1232801 RepID=UPI001C927C13|nr:uncharacterized protein LOC122374462 isoform X1 [Amphibalanus amphitrite]